MVVALSYLSLIHAYRIYYDYGSYSLDITGPLMIITQKVTLLAFSIHDGLARNTNELTKSQQFNAVRKLPSALEYFSYMWHFQSLMAGPLVMYRDYMEFVEGTNILKHSNGNVSRDWGSWWFLSVLVCWQWSCLWLRVQLMWNVRTLTWGICVFVLQNNLEKNGLSKEIVMEPSPMKAVVKKVIGSLICAYIFMKLITIYPIKRISGKQLSYTQLKPEFFTQ